MAANEPEQEQEEYEQERQRLADRVLSILEDAIYWAIAVMLVVGSGALLVSQFNTMLRLREIPANTLILDGLLHIFIVVELLYAVRTLLRSHEIAVEPFLIVGMLAVSRRSWCCPSWRPSCSTTGRTSRAPSWRSAC